MKTIFTLLLSLFTLTAFSQRNFVPGYYLTHEGEKVDVQINDKNWDRNPRFIEVKDGSGDTQRLNVADIRGFVLSSGDVFDAFIVDVDQSPTKLNNILPNSQPLIVRDTVFLRAIVKGAANLYYLRDERAKEHYYIQKGNEVPAELVYRIAKYTIDGKSGYNKLPIYRGMLSAKLTGCPEIAEEISHASYNRKHLKAITEAYNQCITGTKGTFSATEEKIKWNMLAFGGVSYTYLKINTIENQALRESDFNGINYVAGASLLATLPRGKGKWALQGDILYRNLMAEGSFTETGLISKDNYIKTDTQFDLGYIGINTSVRYRLSDTKFRPYISAGVANNFLVMDNSKQQVYRKYYTSESTREQKPLNDMRKHEQALLLGVGVEYNKITTELKVENGNGFSPYSGVKTTRNALTLQLSYTLK